MVTRSHGGSLLLAAGLSLLLLVTGCATTAPEDIITPDTIPFAEIDIRTMVVEGRFALPRQQAHVRIHASALDTLLWVDNTARGGFEQALLRRRNTVYALGTEGDYQRGSTTQEVVYQRLMDYWHTLHAEQAAAYAPSE